MLKNKSNRKRLLWIISAVVFLVVIFFLKTKTQYKNTENDNAQGIQGTGLSYGNEKIVDLINRDTDKDGVLDWEESLWGTDPTKIDTNDDGVPDSAEVAKIKSERGENNPDLATGSSSDEENLTQTDKFARELFSTVTALSQGGEMDQATVDKLSSALAEQIQNSAPKKVFLLSEIKIGKNDSVQAVQSYNDAMESLYKKYPIKGNVLDVLGKLTDANGEADTSVLSELDPIIKQTSLFMNGMVKISVPSSLAQAHLDIINAFERIVENLNDIQLFDSDVIVALSAISQYKQNTDALSLAIDNLVKMLAKN